MTIQGVMTWAFDKNYNGENWQNVFSVLESLKEKGEIHSRILSSSRKFLRNYQKQGFPAPTDFQIRNESDLLIIWGYKGQYLEVLLGIDKRKTPHDYDLKTVITNFNN